MESTRRPFAFGMAFHDITVEKCRKVLVAFDVRCSTNRVKDGKSILYTKLLELEKRISTTEQKAVHIYFSEKNAVLDTLLPRPSKMLNEVHTRSASGKSSSQEIVHHKLVVSTAYNGDVEDDRTTANRKRKAGVVSEPVGSSILDGAVAAGREQSLFGSSSKAEGSSSSSSSPKGKAGETSKAWKPTRQRESAKFGEPWRSADSSSLGQSSNTGQSVKLGSIAIEIPIKSAESFRGISSHLEPSPILGRSPRI